MHKFRHWYDPMAIVISFLPQSSIAVMSTLNHSYRSNILGSPISCAFCIHDEPPSDAWKVLLQHAWCLAWDAGRAFLTPGGEPSVAVLTGAVEEIDPLIWAHVPTVVVDDLSIVSPDFLGRLVYIGPDDVDLSDWDLSCRTITFYAGQWNTLRSVCPRLPVTNCIVVSGVPEETALPEDVFTDLPPLRPRELVLRNFGIFSIRGDIEGIFDTLSLEDTSPVPGDIWPSCVHLHARVEVGCPSVRAWSGVFVPPLRVSALSVHMRPEAPADLELWLSDLVRALPIDGILTVGGMRFSGSRERLRAYWARHGRRNSSLRFWPVARSYRVSWYNGWTS